MLNALITIAFFILVWLAGTFTQDRYWKRVRILIHERARDHEGYLGTGMCKVSFSRKAFVMILTDHDGVINGCYELKGLSLKPEFSEMSEMLGLNIETALDHLANESYHDAFAQAIRVIDRSMTAPAA